MPYPQISGRIEPVQAVGRHIAIAVSILATIIGAFVWIFASRAQTPTAPNQPSPAPATIVVQPARPHLEEDRLHLSHAEQELAIASEQLVAARRLLAALGPSLSRNYLDVEKRRVEAIWMQCDTAQRAIEDARTNITAVSTRKEK